ncbi:MAG: MFS transporter [Oscillospiraceae bacterium]|nr:MFS transporter [Ruminococcus sp.]MDD7337420.1 MFS transporter [Ruminococcus sp.]MDY6060355.1 MFS transporter [Oscillospiraceae bacterium]
MAKETKQVEVVEEEKANRQMPKNRRYVGSRETTAYVLYDIAQSFNLGSKGTYFITDVLVIALRWQTVISAVVSVWDVINDLFLAAIVDRTNTRFGKFKPYLIMYAGPGAILGILYWAMPVFFPGASASYMPKIISYFVLQMVTNLATSLYNIAKTGILATITPDTLDRTRLINQANLISSLVENIPRQAVTIFIDLVNRGVMKIKMSTLFVIMGVVTSAISSLLAFYFSVVYKERVLQSVEKPNYKETLTSIIRSKPLMLLALSDMLASFSSTGTSITLYYINVLNFSSAELVVGVPGMFVTYASYAYVTKLREKFSTKALWIFGDHFGNFLLLAVWIFGSINKNYKKTWTMLIAFMVRETIWNGVYALRKVIPTEIGNEVIDYGEWKYGYRTEGITGVVKGLASKIIGSLGAVINTVLLQAIGYRQGLKPGQQSARTEYLLFLTCTLVPAAAGICGMIPKFFYNIDDKTRKRMYEELAERRSETAKALNADDAAAPQTEG